MKKFLVLMIVCSLGTSVLVPMNAEAAEYSPRYDQIVNRFEDVPEEMWAHHEIMDLTDRYVISGYPGFVFKPYQKITRGQAAILVSRAAQLNVEDVQDPGYSDVHRGMAAYPYIAKLVEEGIFGKAARFSPNEELTRADMAKIIVRTFGFTGTADKKLNDVPEGHWAHPYIMTLYANDLTEGTSSVTYDPDGSVSRAQFSAFISRVFGKVENVPVTKLEYVIEETMKTLNSERAAEGLPPLKTDPIVQELTQQYAEDAIASPSPYEYKGESIFYSAITAGVDAQRMFSKPIGYHHTVTPKSITRFTFSNWDNPAGSKAHLFYDNVAIGYAERGTGYFAGNRLYYVSFWE